MAPYTGPSVSVHVQYFIDPTKVSAFLDVFRPLWKQVTAEPECIFVEVYHNPDVPGEFKLIENYAASREWVMNVQVNKEYYKKPQEETMPLCIAPPKIEIWERDTGKGFLYVAEGMLEKRE